jgi:putative flippase GtrA
MHIQFFRYIFVGGSSAVLDLLVYFIGTEYFGIHYLLANLIAFFFGVSWNYTFGLLWVFESKHKRMKEFFMVFSIAFLGLLWSEILLYLFVDFGHIDHGIAKIIVLWIVLFWNFGMRKFFVFH